MNAVELFYRQIREKPDKVALKILSGQSATFSELARMSSQTRSLLNRLGIKSGDTVLLFDTLNPRLYGSIVGMVSMGVTVAFVEPWMPVKKINHILPLAKPKMFFTNRLGKAWGMRVAAIRNIPHCVLLSEIFNEKPLEEDAVSLSSETPAILAFTSGTTGNPKGVVRTHQYLIDQQRVLTSSLKSDRHEGPDLCIFANFVLSNLAAGRTSIVVPPKWKTGNLKSIDFLPIELQPVSITCGPAFLLKLINHTRIQRMKSVHVGGALVDCAIFERAFTKWPEARWLHVYGSTEVEPVAMMNAREAVKESREKGFFQTLCLGTPVPEISSRFESNTVWVTGPHVCPSYLGNEEESRKYKQRDDQGRIWHRMGDRIQVIDGKWWYAGREKQCLKEFYYEQKLYSFISSSAAFVESDNNGKMRIFCQRAQKRESLIRSALPGIREIRATRIRRDRRHRARIDRAKSRKKSMKYSNWIIYLKERFPLPVYLLLAGGIAVSGTALGSADLLSPAFICSFIGLIVFFAQLRLMDELKDHEKDKIAYPERPLPRGLLQVNEVRKVIILTTWAMLVYGVILTILFSPIGGLPYLILTSYLWLMYREFYIGKWLEQRQLLYAISHQIVVIPVCAFPVLLAMPILIFSSETYCFSFLILGAFFSYEVSRKLDPQAHPVLKTYRSLYGIRGCSAMVLLASFLSAFASWNLGLKYLTWPFLLLLLISYALMNARKHKPIEAIASLSLIIHIWAVALVSIKELF